MSGNNAYNLRKICTCCEQTKDEAEFYFRKSEGRHESKCKACVSVAKSKQYTSKKKRIKSKGTRQIDFDKLNIELGIYTGPERSPDVDEICDILRAFIWEEVLGSIKEKT